MYEEFIKKGYEMVPVKGIQGPPVYRLTTTDNPFNPFTEEDDWRIFDRDHLYFSREYIARVYRWCDSLTEWENQRFENAAILEAVRLDTIADLTNGKVHYKMVVEP